MNYGNISFDFDRGLSLSLSTIEIVLLYDFQLIGGPAIGARVETLEAFMSLLLTSSTLYFDSSLVVSMIDFSVSLEF